MSYRALYRQYRPATFGEMIGQEHITTILKNQVAAGRASHAYLFTGSRGTGKTTAAKILARAVNCHGPEGGEPCLKCAACRRTATENADIIELDAASNNGVDDVRDIIDKARFVPLELRQKVYIIDEAHALSPNAFNALLKTLEEPPAHVMFILATTEPQKIPATIISRCQRMDFHRLGVGDMIKRLEEVLSSAGAEIEREGMLAIARAAEGGMRDCLSLADQCLSFCGNRVTAKDVYSVLGGMEDGFLFSMGEAMIASDMGAVMALMDRAVEEGRDMKVLLQDITRHMRALLVARLCGSCCDILDCTEDAMKRYIDQGERMGEMRLLRACELLLQAEGRLKTVTLPRVLIESTLVRIARPEDKLALDDITERLERLEARMERGLPAAPAPDPAPVKAEEDLPPFDMEEPPAPGPAPAPAPKPVPAPAPVPKPAPAGPAGSPRELWKAVADRLGEDDKALSVMAVFGKAVSFEDGELTVAFDKEIMYKAMTAPQNLPKLQAAMGEAYPGGRLRFVQGGQPGGDSLESRGAQLFGSVFRAED